MIKPSQIWVGTVPLGPGGKVLNSCYKNRTSPDYKNDLGLTVGESITIMSQ